MKKYSAKQRISTIINSVIFISFLFLTFQMFLESQKNLVNWLVMIACIAIFICALYYEYLKYLYNDALYTLNFLLNPSLAEQKYRYLCKRDVFKTYEKNSGIFEVMLSIEQGEPKEALQLIEKNEKKFRTNVELLIVMYYYQIRAYLMLGNTKKVNEVYNNVKLIEKMKKKPNIISYLELKGLHELSLGNRENAYNCFKQVNITKMNPKEALFIYGQLLDLSKGTEKEEYLEIITNLKGAIINESK